MYDEIIEQLKQNRLKLKNIDGNWEQNDYSINRDADAEFFSELSKIDLRKVKNKSQFFSLLNEFAVQTVDKTVQKVSHFSTVSDSNFVHDLRINELYLKDLMDNFINNLGSNIPLAFFYKTQIDYLSRDLKTTPWGEQYVNELFNNKKNVSYEQLSSSFEKIIESTSWSLYWNEEFQNSKDMIKYAISRDCNEINNVLSNIKEDKEFMLELLQINPNCYFGMSSTIKSDENIAKFIIRKDYRQFALFADNSLRNESFLRECNLGDEDIRMIMESINNDKQSTNLINEYQKINQNSSRFLFDTETYKCSSFLEGLSKCNSNEDIKKYVDSIVDSFPHDNTPKTIGTSKGIFSKVSYKNDGEYNGFIEPETKISNASLGYSYHIYDRDYLYSFAYGIKKLDMPNDTNLLPYIMKYLDSYFGYKKDNVAQQEDILYNFAVAHAEEFYKKNGISLDKSIDAVDQMQISGEFPLSALKGTHSAGCMERSALAQNIMKLCGYNSSIMYGECESRGQNEGHCWNSIYDKDGNILIIDFSNTVFSYKDGKFIGIEPYANSVSSADYLAQDGLIEMPDYHYENGKRVRDSKNRKYAIGKKIKMSNELTTENKSK